MIPTETDASAAAQHKAPLTVRIAWEARYTLLLWLSLVCMIPFNLRQFDRPGQSTTVDRITGLARVFIGVTGVEREASVVLVGRLYQRYVIPPTSDSLVLILSQVLRHKTRFSLSCCGPQQAWALTVMPQFISELGSCSRSVSYSKCSIRSVWRSLCRSSTRY